MMTLAGTCEDYPEYQSSECEDIVDITFYVRPYGIEQNTYMTRFLFEEAVEDYERFGFSRDRRLSQIGRAFAEAASKTTGKSVIFSIPGIRHGRRIPYRVQAAAGQSPDGSGCITLKNILE